MERYRGTALTMEFSIINEDMKPIPEELSTKRGGIYSSITPFDAQSIKVEESLHLKGFSGIRGQDGPPNAFRQVVSRAEKLQKIEREQERSIIRSRKDLQRERPMSVPARERGRQMTPLQKYREKYQERFQPPVVAQTTDQSNEVAKVVAEKLHPKEINVHQAPQFYGHHKALSTADSNVFNRKPINDKAKILLDRMNKTMGDFSFKKKKKTKDFIVQGKKEKLSMNNDKPRRPQSAL
jgi:hypothetical protein